MRILRCLITGVNGLLGSHMADFLLAQRATVFGTYRQGTENVQHLKGKLNLLSCDLVDQERVRAIVRQVEPDLVFHLAAQSSRLLSWQDPETTMKVNLLGTLSLLEEVRDAGLDPTVLVACSSAEYGFSHGEKPIPESHPLEPTSPYGVSKAAADMLARRYWDTYLIRVIRFRPFFVIGPRKRGDVCSDFAQGIVAVERGEQEALKVGNVEIVREFLDVRDAMEALWLLSHKGAPGEVYNICSGVGVSIQELLDTLCSLAKRPVPVEQDPGRLRPVDEPVIVGDNSRLRALGWKPRVSLEQSLRDILEYWRNTA